MVQYDGIVYMAGTGTLWYCGQPTSTKQSRVRNPTVCQQHCRVVRQILPPSHVYPAAAWCPPRARAPQPALIGRQGLTTKLKCTSTGDVCNAIVLYQHGNRHSVIQCRPIRAGCGALPPALCPSCCHLSHPHAHTCPRSVTNTVCPPLSSPPAAAAITPAPSGLDTRHVRPFSVTLSVYPWQSWPNRLPDVLSASTRRTPPPSPSTLTACVAIAQRTVRAASGKKSGKYLVRL